jgi:NADH dehydrogenase FAD-containing subunit
MRETDVLLVGFGFSAIPLLRELDLSGVDYTIISEKDGSIWASLAVRAGSTSIS